MKRFLDFGTEAINIDIIDTIKLILSSSNCRIIISTKDKRDMIYFSSEYGDVAEKKYNKLINFLNS